MATITKIRVVSEYVRDCLSELGFKITVAGSIRRKVETPADVDIIVCSKTKMDFKGVEAWFVKRDATKLSGKNKQMRYVLLGVQVDIYYCEPKEYGAMLLFLTGSAGYNIGLRRVAQKKGLKLSQWGLFKGDDCIASETEESIYKALGKEWKPPAERK